MRGVRVARHRGKCLDVLRGQGAQQPGALADPQFVEGVVLGVVVVDVHGGVLWSVEGVSRAIQAGCFRALCAGCSGADLVWRSTGSRATKSSSGTLTVATVPPYTKPSLPSNVITSPSAMTAW